MPPASSPQEPGRRDGWRVFPPLLTLAVVAVTDLVLGLRSPVIGLLTLGPFLAASLVGPHRTMVVGLLAFPLAVALGAYDRILGRAQHVVYLVALALATVIAAAVSASRTRRERELVAARSVAEAAQQAVLHPLPARLGPLRLAARYSSAFSEAKVGGDFYEAVDTPFGVRVVVGDVRGKGLPAVHLASVALGAFREAAFDKPDLPDVAVRMDASVSRQRGDEDFVTALLVEVPPGPAGSATLVNCGHHPPLFLSAAGRAGRDVPSELLDPAAPALPLGLASRPKSRRIRFGPGDRLLLYTDGLVEARNGRTFFPFTEYALAALSGPDIAEGVGALHRTLLRHVHGRLDDDTALLVVERVDERDAAARGPAEGDEARPLPPQTPPFPPLADPRASAGS